MSNTAEPRDWENIVETHKETMHFLPEALLEEAKAWESNRSSFEKEATELARKNASLDLQLRQLMQKIREYFAENGIDDEVWVKDIGFNTEALKEGKYILNITRQGQ